MNPYLYIQNLIIKMSDINKDSKNTNKEPKPEPNPKPTEITNIEKYNIEKAVKVKVEAEKDKEIKSKDKTINIFLQEAIDARKLQAPQYVLNLLEKLDPESQLAVLKAHSEKNADPNTSSIGRPIGRDKDPLEEYMDYNPNKDTITYNIPASVLMNPKKNKTLLGIE